VKIVLTGATGFLGAALLPKLAGHELVVLARTARPIEGARVVEANLEALGPWTEALRGADAVIHMAGEPIAGKRWDACQKQILRDSRVEGTRVLVEAIAALPQRPSVLVSASGADIYPFASDEDDFDDDDVTEGDPPSDSFLGRLCRDWEREALAAEAHGVRVVCMRTGIVIGAGGALGKMTTPFKLYAGGRIGSGRQWFSWIHRDDAVAAYAAALTDARYRGPINLVTDSLRQAAFARALGAALHRPSWLPVPAFALRAAVGELAEYLLHGRKVVPAALRTLGFAFAHPTVESALTASL
jgi:hypothetical protein